MNTWNLDDTAHYFKLITAPIPHAFVWGASHREKREQIRVAVAPYWPQSIPPAAWWAFRLYARKARRNWDVENIPKLVVDAFSHEQIIKDGSRYSRLALYENDTILHVRMVQVAGEVSPDEDSTLIEIFGAR